MLFLRLAASPKLFDKLKGFQMGNYSYGVAKSSTERRQFLKLLEHTIGVLPNPPAPELIALYVTSFQRIGYSVGIKGLKTYIVHSLGSKMPTIAELAELGGAPLLSKVELRDIPDILVARIRECMQSYERPRVVREYNNETCGVVLRSLGKNLDALVQEKAGSIGLKAFQTIGGIRAFQHSEKDLPFIFSNLKSLISSFIKENPHHEEVKFHLQGQSNQIYKLLPETSRDDAKNRLKTFAPGSPNHPKYLLGLDECRRVREKELGSKKTLRELCDEKYYKEKI